MKLKIQSVKFKKDYMMLSAFLLFFAIVAAECFLAIWLPWHLRLEYMWAEQVAQQELVDEFDSLRGAARKYAEKSGQEDVAAEAILINRSLDSAAAYMHLNSKNLDPEQCNSFMSVLKRLRAQSVDLSRGKAYSKVSPISFDHCLKNMRGVKPAPDKKK
jgi:hypothetical protein